MNLVSTDKELGEFASKVTLEARKINELIREGRGYDLMKTANRLEIAVQLLQQRLAELP
jgi:hypothetical protein